AGGLYRVVVANGGLTLYFLPLPSWVRVVLSLVVFGTFLAFLVLALRAVVVSRADAPVTGPGEVAARRDAQARRPRAGAVTAAVATLALAVVGGVAADPVAAGVGSGGTSGAATSTAAGGTTVVATGRTTTVEVEAADMRFVPDVIPVPAGDRLVVELTNTDDDVHDLVLADGSTTGRVAPGETVTLDVGVVVGDLDGWCSVAGHRLMGMTLTVDVDDGGDGAD